MRSVFRLASPCPLVAAGHSRWPWAGKGRSQASSWGAASRLPRARGHLYSMYIHVPTNLSPLTKRLQHPGTPSPSRGGCSCLVGF